MKSLDIQLFMNMKNRMFGQAVSKYMIISVCVMFWWHLTQKGYFGRISFKRGVNTCRDIYIINIECILQWDSSCHWRVNRDREQWQQLVKRHSWSTCHARMTFTVAPYTIRTVITLQLYNTFSFGNVSQMFYVRFRHRWTGMYLLRLLFLWLLISKCDIRSA